MSRASTAAAGSQRAGKSKSAGATRKPAKGYFQISELPLTSLVFLLPLLITYELGTRYYAPEISHIRAFTWMQGMFRFFGASGHHLPALAVVGILLAWHIARRDAWNVNPKHLFGMALESVVLAVPLMLIWAVTDRYIPVMASESLLVGRMILSVGAGIYEELVFRLIAFTILSLLLVDLLGIKRFWAYLLMVVSTSLGFSLYHYLGYEGFEWRTFAFRSLGGFYFGAVFTCRGFGISAGTHAAYDVIASLLLWIG
jgi:hypothetical protein